MVRVHSITTLCTKRRQKWQILDHLPTPSCPHGFECPLTLLVKFFDLRIQAEGKDVWMNK